ncbi:hypothetical protein DEO72_LG11g2030 [Vigna unguiculata]|uniref:Uncharacterized protein n=1 Tax=Vigna unguiculata TaxID=3917 RepID=A0A4D6NPV6_VIGUN|nr:hypothetical protein DEO72_LG11g2030 [Vigna unguiculata]
MLALVVDISAHPRAAHPRAMCYKCYDGSIFPHHKNKQASKQRTASPNPSLRLKGLAQASPPSPRRGLEKGAGAHAGSRLGETPLAWARVNRSLDGTITSTAALGVNLRGGVGTA